MLVISLQSLIIAFSAPLVADSLFRLLYMLLRLARHRPSHPPISNLQSPISNHQSSVISHQSLVFLAVVIPAHDEADVIADTVQRLRRSDYPADRYRLCVIADNCADDTAAVARAAGAQVWERHEPQPRGKAAALAWFVRVAATELAHVDALVILDADSQVAPDCLTRLAEALAHAPVVQGVIQPIHADGATVASLAAYSEILSQTIDDVARAGLGWPVPLRGAGMALPPRLLADLTPQLRTRIEDTELSLLIAHQRIPIAFAPDAIIGDPKPADAALAARQRARWLQGRAELFHLYWPTLLRLLTRRPADAALVLTLALRPKTLVLALKVGLGVTLLAFTTFSRRSPEAKAVGLDEQSPAGYDPSPSLPSSPSLSSFSSFVPLRVTSWMLLASAAIDLAYYVVGLRVVDQPRVYARVLLRAPTYLAMWLGGLRTAATSRDAWLSVRRQKND